MFEQDYIMRLIKEVIRMILKILFNIDTESPITEFVHEKEEKNVVLNELLDMIDSGQINEAENRIYTMMENKEDHALETAFIFYEYLNDKDDEFLKNHDFSREEVINGVKYLTSQCGMESVFDIFFPKA